MDQRSRNSERTPLIAVVRVAPPQQRYKHHRVRRCCNFLLSFLLIISVIVFLFPFIFNLCAGLFRSVTGYEPRKFMPWAKSYPPEWPRSRGIEYEKLQSVFLDTPKESWARSWSKYYTAGPHLAGKNFSQALWTRSCWQELGIENTEIVSYDVYLNYPIGHRLALYEKNADKDSSKKGSGGKWHVKYEASLEEDVLKEDSTTGLENRIPTFHGYSASGNVTAPYVYVNYGTYEDYDDLLDAGIDLKGKIAIAKYGKIFRGLKLRRAAELGIVGMVIYSDPGDDGVVTEVNGVKPYPEGKARNPSSVQRGSVEALNIGPGDPTTPGYPSKPGVPRVDPGDVLPSIPSLPISYQDALPILKALNGYGPKASSFSEDWQGGGLGGKGVKYNIGPSPDKLVLNLLNQQEYVTTPIWNVIGIINGSISDEVVVIGNHRDAWIAGGAGDPNSGSAALNEVVRSFGEALKLGWKPLRTVVFASWDGEEYGLIGSTEWVEEFIPWLKTSAVAYLNVDVGTSGTHFKANANPLVNRILKRATSLVKSPNQTVEGQSVYDAWNKEIHTLGSGSDFTAFQDFAGVPSFDIGFGPSEDDAIYHYHSNYDSFYWMDNFGDPGWHYHVTMAKVWSLAALDLLETPVLPFNVTDYAEGIKTYVEKAITEIQNTNWTAHETRTSKDIIKSLRVAVCQLTGPAKAFDRKAYKLSEKLKVDIPWWKWWEKVKLFIEVRKVNAVYKLFDRTFLYEKGLDRRPLFKHTIFAPEYWRGYAGATLPGLMESIDAKNFKNVTKWSNIIERQLRSASRKIENR